MFGRRESLRELIRNQHAETLRFQEASEERYKRSEERYERLEQETREFNREILLRNEKVYTSVIAGMEEGRRELRRMGEKLEEETKQIRANTEAVLRLLDRFDEPGGATA